MKKLCIIPKVLTLLLLFFIISIEFSQALEAPRITKEELRDKLDKKADIVVVDVRSKDAYDKLHIKGAISIPLEEIEARHKKLKKLPKEKEIVLYCDCGDGGLSARAAQILLSKNFTNVKVLKGGFPEWRRARFPTEVGGSPAAKPLKLTSTWGSIKARR